MTDSMEVTGIVLSSMPMGEADRRVLLLTKEMGKISAFVRGARKPTSSMVAATRPFAFGTFEVHPGKSAFTVHKGDIAEYFEDLSKDMAKYAYGCYFLELAGYFTHENAPASDVLELLYYSLRALLNPNVPDRLVRRVFELKIQALEGVVPDFGTCVRCSEEMAEGVFLPSMMNVVCADCAEKAGARLDDAHASGYPLSRSALYALRFILATPSPKLYTFSLSTEAYGQISSVIERLYETNVDRTLKSREMLSVLAEQV